MSRAIVVLVALVASAPIYAPLLAQNPSAQTPARDTSARPATGTGVIRGRVTEAGTDRPLVRVDIRAISPVISQPRGVKTDASGQYEVTGLPPGQYLVAASKTNYLTTSFGATRAMGPGKGFDLADGQVAEKVNFALPHAGVIAGRVVDEFGDPVPDVQVMTMRYQYANGERRMTMAPGRGTTNDIGEFRVFGLPPGDYFVGATFPYFMSGENDEHVTYAPTFYPGTGDAAEAQRLTLVAGQTVSNVVLSLLPVQPSRISGTVIDSHGRAVSKGFVNINQLIGGTIIGGNGAPLRSDGTFTINGVPPGDYILRTGGGPDTESAAVSLSVNGAELSDIQLITARQSVLHGRIVFGAGAAPLKASAIHLNAIRSDPRLGNTNVTVHDDLTFEIKATAGHFLLRTPNPGSQWRLNRVLADGVDITDTGIDVPPNTTLSNIVVEMTHHVSELSGHVLSGDGQATRDAYVIVFTQDPARWTTQSRHVAMSRPTSDELFHVLVPAGDYFIFATADVEPGEWTDPAYLTRIREHAVPVSIGQDEKKAIDLTLSSQPEF